MRKKMETQSTKWYQKTPSVIVFLVLFFPLGLFLMWRYGNWNKKTKWIISGVFLFLLVISLASGDKSSSQNSAKTATSPAETTTTPTSLPVEKFNIVVTSQIVKKVDGKYRYFFDIRNHDSKPLEGSVTIELFKNQSKSSLAGDTFSTKSAIEPNLGTSVYIDAHTGPTSVHGANGIIKFNYIVKKDDQEVNNGEGQITDKLEDLSI